MKIYQIYFLELNFRLFYIFISYLLCFIIFFLNVDNAFLFETNSLLSVLTTKRLILTKISQLFNTIWFLCNSFSFSFIFPLIFYHILLFLQSGWYWYQIKLYCNLNFYWTNVFVFFYILCHIIVISNLIIFFLYWEIKDVSSLLRIEAEISLFYYVLWSFNFKFFFSYLMSNFFFCVNIILKLFNIFSLYRLFLKSKKLINYCIICSLFILFPPDFFIQILIIMISYLIFEFFFFIICIKIYVKLNLRNAYSKTVIKSS